MKKKWFDFKCFGGGILIFPLLAVVFVLFVSGCQDSDAKILGGSADINAYTVLQGVVTGESLRHSVNRTISLSSSSLTTDTTDTGFEDSTQAEGGMEVALVTESGLAIQRKYFTARDENGGIRYHFEGDFGDGPMRLRFYDDQTLFEVAIGTPGSNAVLDLPPIDYKKAALATRYIEQSAAYRDLRGKTPLEFRNYMDSVVQNLVEPLGAEMELHVANIERVGVNETGELQIFTTDYFPDSYRAPQQARAWEGKLGRMIGNRLSGDEIVSSAPSAPMTGSTSPVAVTTPVVVPRPTPRILVNWLSSIYATDYFSDEETLLYNVNSNWTNENYRSSSGRLYLKFRFKSGFPVEYAADFVEKGWLQISALDIGDGYSLLTGGSGNCRKNVAIKNLPILESGGGISVSLNVRELLPDCYQDLLLTLDGNFTPLRPDEIPMVRARFVLKGA
jgi:hypothetical protein